MTRVKAFRSLGLAALAQGLALAGCASPDPKLYTLAAIPGTPVAIGPRGIELRRIGIAGYLDRPEIVRSAAGFQVQLDRNERWGEPTGGMIERVFTENLVQRLPGASVFSESGAISTRPDVVLEIDLQRLDADAAGEAVLLAQVAIRADASGQPARAETIRLTTAPASPATRDLVAAESALLARLADGVAARIVR